MALTQITPRGQLTLPVEIRKALGLTGGSAVEVFVEGDHIVVQPVVTVPVRIYSEDDLAMFDDAQAMNASDLEKALALWGERESS